MGWTVSVFSSTAAEVGYDEDLGGMVVTWKNGKKSLYSGVTEEKATEVSKAPSVGSMLNSDIKPFYAHRYV
jgi:hypothetical protein